MNLKLLAFIIETASLCILSVLTGCVTTTPSTSVHQPMTVRPGMQSPAQIADGAIYRAGLNFQPLFEDRRARNVGDILTINIVENTSADKKSNTSTNRSSENTVSIPLVAGLPGKGFAGAGLSANTDFKFSGDGASASNNVFTGTLSVTVIEVLPNGNLVVSGEKQIGINQGSEFIRFSGVVNPVTILSGNSVNSVQVADARIEYRSNGQIDSAQIAGWLARFFMTFLPF